MFAGECETTRLLLLASCHRAAAQAAEESDSWATDGSEPVLGARASRAERLGAAGVPRSAVSLLPNTYHLVGMFAGECGTIEPRGGHERAWAACGDAIDPAGELSPCGRAGRGGVGLVGHGRQ